MHDYAISMVSLCLHQPSLQYTSYICTYHYIYIYMVHVATIVINIVLRRLNKPITGIKIVNPIKYLILFLVRNHHQNVNRHFSQLTSCVFFYTYLCVAVVWSDKERVYHKDIHFGPQTLHLRLGTHYPVLPSSFSIEHVSHNQHVFTCYLFQTLDKIWSDRIKRLSFRQRGFLPFPLGDLCMVGLKTSIYST